MVIIVSLILFSAALYYTLVPVMGRRVEWLDSEGLSAESRRDLETQKRIYLKALKDIEFERASGKINDEDFDDLRTYYRKKVSDLFIEIQALGEEDFEDEDEENEYEEEYGDLEDEGDEDWDEEEDDDEDWDDDEGEYDEDEEEYYSSEIPRNRRENAFLGFFWFVLTTMVFLIVFLVIKGA